MSCPKTRDVTCTRQFNDDFERNIACGQFITHCCGNNMLHGFELS